MVLSGENRVSHALSETSNTKRDLVNGLSDDIVLAEIIPRLSRILRWDERPVLNMLSRSWNKAMTKQYTLGYDRLYNRGILSSEPSIFYHCTGGNERSRLSVWNPFLPFSGSTLPQPPISLISTHKIEIAGDGERLYVLIPDSAAEERHIQRDVYHVWMLDLREFNIHWKGLPSLPRLGRHVYAANCEGESYIWQGRRAISSEADGIWKLSRSKENNSEWLWQYINLQTLPPRHLNLDTSHRVPSYIHINEVSDPINEVSDGAVVNSLYGRLSFPYHTLENLTPGTAQISTCFYFIPAVDGAGSGVSETQSVIRGDLYYPGRDTEDGEVVILKLKLEDANTKTVEESEWADFAEYWVESGNDDEWQKMKTSWFEDEEQMVEFAEHFPEPPKHNQGSASAIKVFLRDEFFIEELLVLKDWKNEAQKRLSTVKVAQYGPIYAYQLINLKVVELGVQA